MSHTPGPWKVGLRAMDVGCVNEKIGGYAKLFDVRAWGYLTGTGHGGLGLDAEKAYEIQQANAHLISAAPDLLQALKEAVEIIDNHTPYDSGKARDAISKAEGRQ